MNGIGGTRTRISGLNSGLDTEKLVKDMLAISQTKVDRQFQTRQTLLWRQEAYRTSITAMNSLKNKWFSSSNPSTFLGSASFFASAKASTESKLFSVNALSNAKNGSFTVDRISQLATSYSIKGKSDVAAKLKGNVETDDAKLAEIFNGTDNMGKKGADFDIVLDGVKKTINVQGGTKDEIAANLQTALNTAFGAGRITANFDNSDPTKPTLQLSAGNSKLMIGSTNNKALDLLGFVGGQSTKLRLNDKLSETAFAEKLIGGKFEFTVNDVKFKFTKDNTLNEVVNAINSSNAGVDVSYDELNDTFSINSKVSGTGKNVRISQESGNLLTSMFGTKVGNGISSNKPLYSDLSSGVTFDRTKLNDAKNQGFDITINGTTKTVYIPGVDSSGADLDYSAMTDEKAMEYIQNQINGAFQEGELVKVTKNADGKLSFGVENGGQITLAPDSALVDANSKKALEALGFLDDSRKTNVIEGNYTFETITGSGAVNKSALSAGQTFDLTIDGVTKTITLPTDNTETPPVAIDYANLTDAELSKIINSAVSTEFGANSILQANFSVNGGKLSIYSYTGSEVSIGGNQGTLDAFGITATDRTTNLTGRGGAMSELGIPSGDIVINGETFTINANTKIADFIKDINTKLGAGTVAYKDGQFDLRNVTSVSGNTATIDKMFGVDSFNTTGAADAYASETSGVNAKATVNGTEVERSSNTFTFDGVEVTLKGLSPTDANGNVTEPAGTVNVAANVDDAVTKIKDFIKDYNALIDILTSQTTTKGNKDYQPLTDAQKKNMSEQQIKDWEKVAKQGILYNDTELNRVLGDLRTSMYSTSDVGMALYEMGITTGDYKNGGKLEFAGANYAGVTGEDKLRKALAEKPDAVAALFTDPVKGIAAKVANTLDSAASTSATKKGSLVLIAGVEKHSSEKDNRINKSIRDVETLIVKYQKQLADEEDRYWAQFNALESAMAKLNNQQSFLVQQLGQ